MKKKGLVISTLALMGLLIFVFIIILFLLGYMWLFANEASDREICKFSLLAATKTKTLYTDSINFKVDCKRYDLFIEYKDVKSDDPETMNENIYKILQRELYECYNMIPENLMTVRHPFSLVGGRGGEATEDPWDEWQYKNNICLICSVISFDKDLRAYYRNNKEGNSLDGFNKWLLENPVPEAQANLKYVLFRQDPTEEDLAIAKKFDEIAPIDPSENYVIVVRWRAEGVMVDFKVAALGSLGILQLFNIPDYIKRVKSLQCLYSQDEDNIRCDERLPIMAMVEIGMLGEDLSKISDSGVILDAKHEGVSGTFCTMLWN